MTVSLSCAKILKNIGRKFIFGELNMLKLDFSQGNLNETPMENVSLSPEKLYLSCDPANARKFVFLNSVRINNHGFIQILFVSSGSGKAILDGKEYSLKPGFFLILNQDVAFEIFPVSPIIVYSCSFLPELFGCYSTANCSITDLVESDLLSFFFKNDQIDLPVSRVNRLKLDLFRNDFNKMILLTDNPTPAYRDLMRLYIAELLIHLSECFYKPLSISDEDIDDIHIIRMVTSYIRENYADKHTYESLARIACVSRSKLFSTFKEETGKSIGDYIKTVRINQACAMLSETDKSVYDIMLEVGYNDMKMFCKRFRECIGATPTEYRKRYRSL